MSSTAAASPVAHGLLLGTVAVWALLELRQSFNHRPEGVKAGWGTEIVFRLAVAAGAAGAILFVRTVPGAAIRIAATPWIGLALLWCGIALRFWSFQTLGRYFTFVVQTSDDQPVITGGPYRVIRHPSYAGILLAVLGLGLYTRNWLALAILVIAIGAGLVYRIQVEERVLLKTVGDGYRDYAATRKRLIPYIW